METDNRPDQMTAEELKVELERLKECLCDSEDTHLFFFDKTSVHLGAEKAQKLLVRNQNLRSDGLLRLKKC